MRKVKLLLFTSSDYSRYYSSELVSVVTEWEEVTDEEFLWLNSHVKDLEAPDGLHYVLVAEDVNNIKYHINSIRQFLEEEKTKQEAEMAKKAKANRKREETKRKNKEEKERKMLEELKEKYA